MTREAITLLQSPWRQFFSYYDWFLTDAVAYPDTHYRGTDPNEGPRHYVDLEVWNPNNQSTGTLPQAVNEFTHKMQLAIEAKDWNSVFLLAGRVAHYVEDDTQPYHTTINYDPLTKTGVGLHSVLDSSLVNHLNDIEILTPPNPATLTPIENLTDFALKIAYQSHSYLPIINQTLITEGLNWSPELTRIIENRTNTAITAVARVWYTAIIAAKSPAPTIPTTNQLSIIVEDTTQTVNGLVLLRIRVVDSLEVSTYANVTLKAGSSTFQGHIADTFPPIGEYVVVCETELRPTLTAQRDGYVAATVVLSNIATSVTSQRQSSNTTTRSVTRLGGYEIPTVTIVALVVMVLGIIALVVLQRVSKNS